MQATRAAILAGGHSSRMGEPKAGLDLAGTPLISHPTAAAREAGLEPLVVAKASTPLPDVGCEVVIEQEEPVHPLAGIIAALEAVGEPLVVLACDTPLVPPALIAALAAREEPLVVPADPRPQPLVARWSPELLSQLRSALATASPLKKVVADLGAVAIAGDELATFGDPERMFANVNDPVDLRRIESLIR